MKKFFALFLSFSLLLSLLPLFGEGEVVELKVYNWEDYISIDDGSGESVDLIKKFEQHCKEKFGLNVKVKYCREQGDRCRRKCSQDRFKDQVFRQQDYC